MSINKGSLCKVVGSNFDHYVIALSAPVNDCVCVVNDNDQTIVYDVNSLQHIRTIDIATDLQNISSLLTNTVEYQKYNEQFHNLHFLKNNPEAIDYIALLISQENNKLRKENIDLKQVLEKYQNKANQ